MAKGRKLESNTLLKMCNKMKLLINEGKKNAS